MSVAANRSYAWRKEFFAKLETAYGTINYPIATDAIPVLSTDMTFKQERLRRDDSSGYRSYLNNKFSGRKTAEWSVKKYIVPSGSAGTAPDDAAFWQGLMGDAASSGGTVTYSLDDDDLPSLSMYRFGGHFEQGLYGAVVQQGAISIGGSDFSTVEFSGVAKDHIWAGVSSSAATANSGATSIVVDDPDMISTYSVIRVGTSVNGATGHHVTAKTANGTCTIDPGLDSTQATGVSVEPIDLTQTTAGDALHGIVGSFSVGGSNINIMSASVTINNNIEVKNDEYGSTNATEIVYPSMREVTGTFELSLTKAYMAYYGESARFLERAIVLTCGTTAGKRMQISLPQCEFEIPAIAVPEGGEGEVTATVAFEALATTAGQDEVTIYFI